MNKRVLSLVVLVALTATPAFAYVSPKAYTGGGQPINLSPTPIYSTVNNYKGGFNGPVSGPGGNCPSHPVPEPGTMAMASMGLMALGASLRRRKNEN